MLCMSLGNGSFGVGNEKPLYRVIKPLYHILLCFDWPACRSWNSNLMGVLAQDRCCGPMTVCNMCSKPYKSIHLKTEHEKYKTCMTRLNLKSL